MHYLWRSFKLYNQITLTVFNVAEHLNNIIAYIFLVQLLDGKKSVRIGLIVSVVPRESNKEQSLHQETCEHKNGCEVSVFGECSSNKIGRASCRERV